MLVILRKGPMYGYEVLKVLREEFQGFWEPQTGAMYRRSSVWRSRSSYSPRRRTERSTIP